MKKEQRKRMKQEAEKALQEQEQREKEAEQLKLTNSESKPPAVPTNTTVEAPSSPASLTENFSAEAMESHIHGDESLLSLSLSLPLGEDFENN